MFVRKRDFDATVSEILTHQDDDCRDIGNLEKSVEGLVEVAHITYHWQKTAADQLDALWQAVANLEAVVYESKKPAPAAKPKATEPRTAPAKANPKRTTQKAS